MSKLINSTRQTRINLLDFVKSGRLFPTPTSVNRTITTMSSANFQEQVKQLASDYERNGYGVFKNFLTETEVISLRQESSRLIREESKRDGKRQIFGNEFNMKSRYFLESADQICYFFEKEAFDLQTLELKVPEEQSVAKIAHALHCLNPVFKDITTNSKVQEVFKSIGFVDPRVAQSMVIFKNPQVGGAYTPHQDASFLYTEPLQLAGIWLALDDATPENGCLEFIPGSHKWPLYRRFVRTNNTEDGQDLLEWTAPVHEFDDHAFVKVPVKKGDMVLIHGLVVHRSAANKSQKSRWIYTFHAFDKGRSTYSDKNWLQPVVRDSFTPIYT